MWLASAPRRSWRDPMFAKCLQIGRGKRAGVRFRCHDLRHKFAIDYLREHGRNPLPRLSEILGHSSVKTTEMYVAYVGPESAHETTHIEAAGAK